MVILQSPTEIFKVIDPKEFRICAATTFSVVVVSMDRPCTILESSCSFVSRRPISSVGRAPVCWAGVREFKPRPDRQPKTGEIMLAVKPLSHFGWSRHWEVTLSRWPCTSVGRARKEPVTLFEKSRGRRPRCHGLSDLCRHRSRWARCDQNMDWSDCKSAPLHADIRSHLYGSSATQPLAASEESWHRKYIYFLTLKGFRSMPSNTPSQFAVNTFLRQSRNRCCSQRVMSEISPNSSLSHHHFDHGIVMSLLWPKRTVENQTFLLSYFCNSFK